MCAVSNPTTANVLQYSVKLLSYIRSALSCTRIHTLSPPNEYQYAVALILCRVDSFICCVQVKYLGLMENLRVRRAGFAYRRPHKFFLQRYKSLCPATWPHYHGPDRRGVETLVKHLNYGEDDYRLGKYVSKLIHQVSDIAVFCIPILVFFSVPRYLYACQKSYLPQKRCSRQGSMSLLLRYKLSSVAIIRRNSFSG